MVLDETSVAIQGFEDRYTEYSIRLNSVTVDNGTATAEVGIRRFGESAYVDYPAVTIRVNGRSVSYSGEVPGPRDGFYPTDTVSFDAAPGDTIEIEWVAQNWDGESGVVSTTLPNADISTVASISPTSIYTGEVVEVSVSAQNDGNAAGEVAAVLSVDGVGIDAATLSVGPGESVSKRFEVDFSVAGSYTVAIETDRTVAERFISVSYPTPDPSADSCSVLPSSVTTGEPFTVTASISNSGAGGEVVARLSDQNGEIESTTLSVESGGSQPVDFEVIYDEPNLNGYDISFDALSPPFVGVEITEARIR